MDDVALYRAVAYRGGTIYRNTRREGKGSHGGGVYHVLSTKCKGVSHFPRWKPRQVRDSATCDVSTRSRGYDAAHRCTAAGPSRWREEAGEAHRGPHHHAGFHASDGICNHGYSLTAVSIRDGSALENEREGGSGRARSAGGGGNTIPMDMDEREHHRRCCSHFHHHHRVSASGTSQRLRCCCCFFRGRKGGGAI